MKVSLEKEVYSTEYQHKKKLEKMVDVMEVMILVLILVVK